MQRRSTSGEAARRGEASSPGAYKLHVVAGDEGHVPEELRARKVLVKRADGEHEEPCVGRRLVQIRVAIACAHRSVSRATLA